MGNLNTTTRKTRRINELEARIATLERASTRRDKKQAGVASHMSKRDNTPPNACIIPDLPATVWAIICNRLPYDDVCALMSVSRLFPAEEVSSHVEFLHIDHPIGRDPTGVPETRIKQLKRRFPAAHTIEATKSNRASFAGDGRDIIHCSRFDEKKLRIPFSVTCWVKPRRGQVAYAGVLGNHGEPFKGFVLQQHNTVDGAFYFAFGDGRAWSHPDFSGLHLEHDAWQQVAVSVSARTVTMTLVRDGRVGEVTSYNHGCTHLEWNHSQPFKIGAGYHSGRFFRGSVSDVCLYDRCLSEADEVLEAANAGPNAENDPTLLAWWPLNEEDGDTTFYERVNNQAGVLRAVST